MKTTTISFLINDSGVLLSEKKRGFGKGFLNGYGGKVSEGEQVEEAAARELNEESGLTANPKEFNKVAVIDFFDGDEHIFECHVFFISKWEGEIKESEEMAQPALYQLDNIPYKRMWASDRAWLPLIFSGEKIKAKAYYRKGMDGMKHFEHKPLVIE